MSWVDYKYPGITLFLKPPYQPQYQTPYIHPPSCSTPHHFPGPWDIQKVQLKPSNRLLWLSQKSNLSRLPYQYHYHCTQRLCFRSRWNRHQQCRSVPTGKWTPKLWNFESGIWKEWWNFRSGQKNASSSGRYTPQQNHCSGSQDAWERIYWVPNY